MNNYTTICLTLAKEVLSLCEEKGIPCILSNESAQKMMAEDFELDNLYLLVTVDNFDRLFNLLAAKKTPFRAVEGMKNNNRYPELSMRYVDTSTRCIFPEDVFLYSSVGIYIVPVRKRIKHYQEILYSRLENWDLNAASRIYPRLLKLYKLGGENRGIIRDKKMKSSEYNISEFAWTHYMRTKYGVFPVSSLRNTQKKHKYYMYSFYFYGDTCCSEISPHVNGVNCATKNIFFKMLKIGIKKALVFIWRKMSPIKKDWERVNCVNTREQLKDAYKAKKPLILELYKNKDIVRLKEELQPFHKKMEQYYRSIKVTIVFDKEFFEIYRNVYGTGKNKKHVNKMARKVPKCWKN